MTVQDISFLEENLILQLLISALTSCKRFWITMVGLERSSKLLLIRGTQFYANKKDKNEESQSRFEAFLLEKEIQHIKAMVKQTNGKVEKWFDLYEKYRLEFGTVC